MPEHAGGDFRGAAAMREACDAFWERRGVKKKSMAELRDDWFTKKKGRKKKVKSPAPPLAQG